MKRFSILSKPSALHGDVLLKFSYRTPQRLLLLYVLLLFIGTQMPGAWRSGLEGSLNAPFGLSSWAHFVLFASMACVANARPLNWPWQRVLLAALGLALLSGDLQFFAIDGHPRMIDVGIGMAGALAVMVLIFFRKRTL